MRPDSRFPHVHEFIAWDLEWYPGTYQLRMCGVYDERGYRWYTDIKSFLARELCPFNSHRRFYAHAGGLADICFLLKEFLRGEYQCKGTFSGSSLTMLEVRKGRYSWTFVDSLWTLRESLAKIGDALGERKGEVDFETDNFAELRTYNEQDCRILWLALHRLQEQLNDLGGELRITLASCALDLFKRRFLTKARPPNPEVNEFARDGYIASRVEVFRYRCEEGEYHDINSSFPASGVSGPLPGELIGRCHTIPDSGLFLTRARVYVPDQEYPPLPRRYNGRITHPVGTWDGVWSRDDITALELGGGKVEHVYETLLFADFWDLREFFSEVYKCRCSFVKGSYEYLIYKLLLNSLYGKFAERRVKHAIIFDPYTIEPDDMMLMPGIWVRPEEIELPHEHVAYSMAITSRSRLALLRLILASQPAYYCDTDAVIGSVKLPCSDELGGLKHEGTVADGWLERPKAYSLILDDKRVVKAKGFSKLTYAEYVSVTHNQSIKRERMLRVREMLRSGDLTPRGRINPKSLRASYIPNRCRLNWSDTRPWTIAELEKVS